MTISGTSIDLSNLPRFASGVTAIYGLSGAGKSSLADTAAEYVADRFGQATMCIAVDPGGWGNRRLSLIHAGVMRVYDPRNHVNFFETMEALSKGAFPETLIDPDRGYADPNVKLIYPRQPVWVAKCPSGHDAARYTNQAVMLASTVTCPTCGVVVNSQNQTTEQQIIRPAMFKNVGLRIFDSITAMNDLGLIIELPNMSARGELPTSGGGGSALGSADAIRQGDAVFGTGSKAQVGFMQNRTYGWLTNIRAIPDQVLGAVCTFGVEQSGGDDTRGGAECYGPALAGTARTARSGGWVGNLLHATKEPDDLGRGRHRLWLTNHIDPRDVAKRPYLAKHRGTPLGMPDFLEDPWDDDPAKRVQLAWTQCSLKYFFELLEKQFAEIAAADAARFAKFSTPAEPAQDEVLSTKAQPTAVVAPAASAAGARTLRRAGQPAVPAAPAPQPSIIETQLRATLDAAGGTAAAGNGQAAAASTPAAAMPTASVEATPAPPAAPSAAALRSPLRRAARPPTT